MQLVGAPELKKPLPRTGVEALLSAVAQELDTRRTDWKERDSALILTALLAGLRAEELRLVDVGDVRTLDDGSAVINAKGKGGKERIVPIEASLLAVIGTCMNSRAGLETRSAAAQNQLYSLITKPDTAAGPSSSGAEARRS
jgi:integrase